MFDTHEVQDLIPKTARERKRDRGRGRRSTGQKSALSASRDNGAATPEMHGNSIISAINMCKNYISEKSRNFCHFEKC